MNQRKSLRPAQLEPEHVRPSYMPRIPWRWVGLGLTLVSVVAGGHWLKERRKAETLRAQILQVHERELAEPRKHYLALRDRLEGWAAEAASDVPDDFVDPRLQLAKLGTGKGLYLRLPHNVAKDPEALRSAARVMSPDAISRCLGLAPTSARGLYERGAFLEPEWLDEAKESYDARRLAVIDDELARRIQRDLPSVLGLARSDWFMLVLQHELERADGPVDVFLWDLHSGQALLRTRVESRGLLLAARYEGAGAPPAPRHERRVRSTGADDCSIAAQVKALAGDRPATVSAAQAAVQAALQAQPQNDPEQATDTP